MGVSMSDVSHKSINRYKFPQKIGFGRSFARTLASSILKTEVANKALLLRLMAPNQGKSSAEFD